MDKLLTVLYIVFVSSIFLNIGTFAGLNASQESSINAPLSLEMPPPRPAIFRGKVSQVGGAGELGLLYNEKLKR